MKIKITHLISLIIFLFTAFFSYADVKCTRPTIGFFNGMLNSRDAAQNNFAILKLHLRDADTVFTEFRLPFEYVLFYNSTSGLSKDINEVFSQLKEEETGNIVLSERTQADRQNHEKFASDVLKQGMGLLLVGHSQGNFFLNHIYKYCKSNGKSVPCNAVHVASPSIYINGKHYLSSNDLIIKSFYMLTKREFVPNITIPYNLNDVTGHGFIDTYLDKKKPAAQNIIQSISTSLLDFCPFI